MSNRYSWSRFNCFYLEEKSLNSPITVWWPEIIWNFILFLIYLLYSLTLLISMTNLDIFFIEPGKHTIALSISSASRFIISKATLSPCWAEFTYFLNICIDLIFDFCCTSQTSTYSPAFILPYTTVPVKIVPFPFILKQWSANMINFLSTTCLVGICNYFIRTVFKSLQYFYTFSFAE